MLDHLTLTDLQAVTGSSENNLERWLERLPLVTDYEETVKGVARKFSRNNAVELGVIARLVQTGMKPARAAEVAAELIKVMKDQKPQGFLTLFPGGTFTISDAPPSAELLQHTSAVVVNVRQLEREIDTYLMKLTPDQIAAIEKMARTLLIIEPQDRAPAILTLVGGYEKAVRAKYPDLPEEKIESAVFRFGDLIWKRFNELNANAGGRA
jgi:hypothetical protein